MFTTILIFFFLSLGVVYLFLRSAINRNKITRIEHGNQVEIYNNGQLIDSYTKTF